jgi:hypothetical protein
MLLETPRIAFQAWMGENSAVCRLRRQKWLQLTHPHGAVVGRTGRGVYNFRSLWSGANNNSWRGDGLA